jgi:hypothetical protein
MKAEDIRVVEINTTAFEEENFILVTDLTDEEIEEVIRPIVLAERNQIENDDDVFYDNETLVGALLEKYPNNLVSFYTDKNSIELIEI